MFTLGIPLRDYRRATQVLGYEAQAKDGKSIEFDVESDKNGNPIKSGGFYQFNFPNIGEKAFSDIAILLDKEGVRAVGSDEALTEKKIMKLADLITELAPTTEELERPVWLDRIIEMEAKWSSTTYQDDRTRAEHMIEDTKVYIEAWENHIRDEKKDREEKEREMGTQGEPTPFEPSSDFIEPLAESKLRSLIRKTIRK